jgi:inward rectifier potassium channel
MTDFAGLAQADVVVNAFAYPRSAAVQTQAFLRTHTMAKEKPFISIKIVGRPWAPWEDIYHSLMRMPWFAFLGILIATFVGINLVFAALYLLDPSGISGLTKPDFEHTFYFSVQTFATIGYGSMAPISRLSHGIVVFEAITGVLSSAFTTGLTFAKFSRPTARILFSQKLVVLDWNGKRTLMVRLANSRHNTVVEARLVLILLVLERTVEGHMIRKPVELPLVRDRSATFILSWSAMHIIDAQSPLFQGLAELQKSGGELFVTFSGIDETTGQTIHARHSYSVNDIQQDHVFEDIITVLPDGTREMNYENFHKTKPVAKFGKGIGAP